MEFELKAKSPDIYRPVHLFPGDESITPEEYADYISNKKYASLAAAIINGAQSFGLDLDRETFERWKRLALSAGLIDDFLDESPDRETAQDIYQNALKRAFDSDGEVLDIPDELDTKLRVGINLLANSVRELPAEQKKRLFHAARAIGEAVIAKAACTDMDEYAVLLHGEAAATATLIYGSASPSVNDQQGFESFTQWCENAMEAGTFLDSSRDLWRDVREGRTSVGASVLRSMHLASLSKPSLGYMLQPGEQRQATTRGMAAWYKFRR